MLDASLAWEQAGISNDFLFCKIMQKPENCRPMLERILGVVITGLCPPKTQYDIDPAHDSHGVRYDVFTQDEQSAYDVEVQTVRKTALAKRSRYYGGAMDVSLLGKGMMYKQLKKCFVIFICTFDPFGLGRHIYTFENFCKEDRSLPLGDGSVRIFLNTTGTMNDVSPELKSFLDYVGGQPSGDAYIRQLEQELRLAKLNKEWRDHFMRSWMRDLELREEGALKKEQELTCNVLRKTRNAHSTASLLDIPLQDTLSVAQAFHIPLEDYPDLF